MIRIILHGSSGRMGKEIIRAVELSPDCTIVAGINRRGPVGEESFPVMTSLQECNIEADALLDFSSAECVPNLLNVLLSRRIPAVIATTGIPEGTEKRIKEAAKTTSILRADNMSVGVNLVKSLIYRTATVLGPEFEVEIIERHHNQKKDSPSGTAKILADAVNRARNESMNYVFGRYGIVGARDRNDLGIHAVRAGTIVGEHDVLFAGNDEIVEVSHKAYSRRVFAEGALAAARYLLSKPVGFYTMDDLVAEQTVVTNVYWTVDEALVEITGIPSRMENLAVIFRAFAEARANVDMISQGLGPSNTWDLSFTVENGSADRVEGVIKTLTASIPDISVRVENDIAKITVEGLGMETQSGVAFRVFQCMADARIPTKVITTSETKIAFVVAGSNLEGSLEAVKTEFRLL